MTKNMKTTTTISPPMKGGPTEVLNIGNFRATLTTSPSSPARSFSQSNGMQRSPSPQPQYQQQSESVQPLNGSGSSSSKVIQRLTSDNDRLRRELRAERAAKEEAQEELRAQKNLFASLQSQTSNLEHIHGNERLLAERKERKIAQLKESLETETSRRSQAEDRAKEALEKFGEVHATAQKEVAEAHLATGRAEAAYETLRQSYRSLQDDVHRLRGTVQEVQENNRRVDERVERISLISDERDKHQALASHINGQQRKRLDEYQARDERMARLELEMEDAVRAMRWVVKIHGQPEATNMTATSEQGGASPPKPTRQAPARPK